MKGKAFSNVEVEKALIGAVLYDPAVFADVAQTVRAEDFTDQKHRAIWLAMERLSRKGHTWDVVTLSAELNGKVGTDYLAHLMAQVPSALHARVYAEQVENMAMRRRIVRAAQDIVQRAGKGASPEALVARFEEELQAVLARRLQREIGSARTVAQEVFESLATRARENDVGVLTGFDTLDALLGGLHSGELVYLAGRPGMGKTALLLSIARRVAEQGRTVLFFLMEMSREQVMQRLISQVARVPLERFRVASRLRNEDWDRIGQAVEQVSELPLFIDDSPIVTPMNVRARARQVKAEYGLDLVLLDYIQLMSAEKRIESRVQEVTYISRMLKQIARDLGVPLVSAAQLSRAVEQRADKRPMLSDLRESGGLEQDADIVMFLYRPEKYGVEVPKGETEVIVAKHRNGREGKVILRFVEEFTDFAETRFMDIQ